MSRKQNPVNEISERKSLTPGIAADENTQKDDHYIPPDYAKKH